MPSIPSPTRLMIIDDDPIVRALARESLQRQGFVVVEAESGERAIALLEADRPDLVMLDVVMPGMDGFDVCRRLRADGSNQRLPILMLTGLDDTDSIRHAYEAGATDFITKPINWTLLEHRVRYALRSSRAMEALAQSQAQLANAQRIAHLGSWEWVADEGVSARSDEYLDIFGAAAADFGESPLDVLDWVLAQDRAMVRRAIESALSEGRAYSIDFRISRADGEVRALHEQVQAFRDSDGALRKIEGITQDITDRVEAEARIRFLADYDPLTGLPNRKLFQELMQQALRRSGRLDSRSAILLIDLDRFKRINDTLGHEIGDQVLKGVAARIAGCVRAADIVGLTAGGQGLDAVARLGGDEFSVLISDLADADAAARVAARVLRALDSPIRIGDHELAVTASIGIAVHPENGADADTLLRNADTAMYAAKDDGRARFQFYAKAMNERSLARLNIENDLRRALDRGELCLYFQPKVDVRTRAVVGAEALLRWRHPERGMVPPMEFIPVAEEAGLIGMVTRWVLQAACEQSLAWEKSGIGQVALSVNLSGADFRNGAVISMVDDVLSRACVRPDRLELEVTEGILLHETAEAIRTLRELKAMGPRLAVDDFGTGYSSLAYLTRFPIDVLKIDRSFVQKVTDSETDAAIASVIVAMAKHLRLSVVAEGVETRGQADFLLARGCHIMQGFLFARPMPADEFAALLARGPSAFPA